MSRSLKKGPYIDYKLSLKVDLQKKNNDRKAIKTWARNCTITPDMVGHTFDVHNGKYFHKVFVTESMVGHKLGEFSITRRFVGHAKSGKIAKSSGSTGRVAS